MSDVLICQTNDGGEINVVDGVVELTDGLESEVYLALFGGNDDDPGGSDKTLEWWGSINEDNPYRSETQHLLTSLTPTSANLRRLENAIRRDLEYLKTIGAVEDIESNAVFVAVGKIEILIVVNGNSTLKYSINWESMRK